MDLLELDEVVEDVVLMDNLEAVTKSVAGFLVHQREVTKQLVVLVAVGLGDDHILLLGELLESLFYKGVAQVVDVLMGEEEGNAEGVGRIVWDILQVLVYVADA